MLKAALNHAYDDGHVANRDAWGRKLKPFKGVEVARARYLTVAESERLLNASDPDFRPLVRAALETGCRYSELARMAVQDFNPGAKTVVIPKSKSGKVRHVILTPEGAEFFRQHCAGRGGAEPMFRRANGAAWKTSEQGRPMRAACARARITPAVSFHALRHTWASHAAMGRDVKGEDGKFKREAVPLMVIAKNLGHADTRMVEKHYGHLAPSFITEAIHAGASRFADSATASSVVPMPGKSKVHKAASKKAPAS